MSDPFLAEIIMFGGNFAPGAGHIVTGNCYPSPRTVRCFPCWARPMVVTGVLLSHCLTCVAVRRFIQAAIQLDRDFPRFPWAQKVVQRTR